MKMIWRSEHGKTFDVLFSESDPFLELKRIIKNHSDFLFYPSSCNARSSGNAEAFPGKSRTSRRSFPGG